MFDDFHVLYKNNNKIISDSFKEQIQIMYWVMDITNIRPPPPIPIAGGANKSLPQQDYILQKKTANTPPVHEND